MQAQIQLESYYVSDMIFKYSRESEKIAEKQVSFSHQIKYKEIDATINSDLEVTIGCSVKDISGLFLEVVLNGYFGIAVSKEVKDDHQLKDLCERNTLSILFPYLRSVISDISLKANIDPIILPTINIIALLEDQKNREKLDDPE